MGGIALTLSLLIMIFVYFIGKKIEKRFKKMFKSIRDKEVVSDAVQTKA